jgi:DNA-directed RNA polymerase subunit alpha
MNVANDLFGQFEFRPLEPGYGITIGNALRRILLSSLEGYAITAIKIDKVDHEFSTIKGVVEDVTEIVLNLKQIRFKKQIPESKGETVSLVLTGSDKFTAADIGEHVNEYEVLNSDFVICHLDPKVTIKMELTIGKGRGYVPAEENKPANAPIGLIPIDSIFTPVRNVKFMIENYRVEQKTDYEKLIIEITTDGSISPKDALKEAAEILIKHFVLFSDEKITFELQPKAVADDIDENSLHLRQLLKTKLADMDLSVRAMNCLKAADLETLGELVSFSRNDLLKFRNFGKKSLTELEELVKNKGLQFGMNLSKFKLDKD